MRKLMLSWLIIPGLACASSLDMNNLKCRNLKITASTSLKQVQDSCLIKDQKVHSGMYEVKFVNDTTKKTVKCDFADDNPASLVNGCR